VLAHTQIDNLPLIQLVALSGLGGITFLVALGSGLGAAALSAGGRAVRADLVAFAALVLGTLLYGVVRLGQPSPGPTVRLAAVASPVTHRDFRAAAGNVDTLRRLDAELFARTDRAADRGARVIVWDEVATMTIRAGEAALSARGQSLARDRGVMLVMAYGVVESMQPFHYVNKYRVFLPDGTLADDYIKRHPVPVDPNTPGTAHARVVSFAGTSFSGGVCYDYSFPEIARDNALDGAEVALVPSSDWKGIDPQHGRMAMMNAVAVGLPLLRPVRAATSFATDAYGRVLGSMRSDASGDGVMVADVPTARVPTLYLWTGEVVPLVALVFLSVVALRLVGMPRLTRVALRPS
jgi:apolipoprotein N-acyltransferase